MSEVHVETVAEKEERERKEREERSRNKNKNKINDDTKDTSVITGDQMELENHDDHDNEEEDDDNDNDNDNDENDNGKRNKGRSGKKSKRGISDTEDDMDGLRPANTRTAGITGRKRSLNPIQEDMHALTQRFIRKEITEENYLMMLKILNGDNGMDGGNTSKGSKSRKRNKRSSLVRPFLFSFLSVFSWCAVFFMCDFALFNV